MSEKIIKFPKQHTDWEITKKPEHLIKAAERCVQYLEENSVGYYYYHMLQELKKLTEINK